MAALKERDIVIDSFFDGITGAAFFGKLRRPGAPTIFCDEDAAKPSEEEVAALVQRLEAASQVQEMSTSGPRSQLHWKCADDFISLSHSVALAYLAEIFIFLSLLVAAVYLLVDSHGLPKTRIIGISTGVACAIEFVRTLFRLLRGTTLGRGDFFAAPPGRKPPGRMPPKPVQMEPAISVNDSRAAKHQ